MQRFKIWILAAAAALTVSACKQPQEVPWESLETAIGQRETRNVKAAAAPVFSLADIPAYCGQPYVAVNGNVPFFSDSELTGTSFETYSDLDSLGRCGAAYASVGINLMPTEERGRIGQVRPSGWHTIKYDVIADRYLYNRCHLIGYQLTGENDNEKNLITGTRYLNINGMQPFENMAADYVRKTENHVLYRVTPVFEGDNLVASGVLMEAKSVEDDGEGILYCVYAYNVQPGVTIDYATGDSALSGEETDSGTAPEETGMASEETGTAPEETGTPETTVTEVTVAVETTQADELREAAYILNTNTRKFHDPSCPSVLEMKEKNKKSFTGNRDEAISQGYVPCKRCNP